MARQAELIGEVIGKHEGVRPADQGEGDSILAAFARQSYPLARITEQNIVVDHATQTVSINLAVDLLYAWLDPRIRYE